MGPNQPNIKNDQLNNQSTISDNPTTSYTAFNNSSKLKKSKGLIVGMVICSILAVAGVAFGIYEFLDSNQKSTQISALETNIENKNAQITELETTISSLNMKDETTEVEDTETIITIGPEAEDEGNAAKIILGDILDENATRKVFKIGECTADGGTAASGSSLSVKCPITTGDGEGLISYSSNDGILRLSLPNN